MVIIYAYVCEFSVCGAMMCVYACMHVFVHASVQARVHGWVVVVVTC